MTYGCETWNTTVKEEFKLASTQRSMERKMCNVSLSDKIPNDVLRAWSGLEDIVKKMYISKSRWAGHVIRDISKWSAKVQEWIPRDRKRPQGRPPLRWADPMLKLMGAKWMRIAKNRNVWKKCELHSRRNG